MTNLLRWTWHVSQWMPGLSLTDPHIRFSCTLSFVLVTYLLIKFQALLSKSKFPPKRLFALGKCAQWINFHSGVGFLSSEMQKDDSNQDQVKEPTYKAANYSPCSLFQSGRTVSQTRRRTVSLLIPLHSHPTGMVCTLWSQIEILQNWYCYRLQDCLKWFWYAYGYDAMCIFS